MVGLETTVPGCHFLLLLKRALVKTTKRIRTNAKVMEKSQNTCRNSTKIKRNKNCRKRSKRSRPSALLAQEKCLKTSNKKCLKN